MDEDKNLPIAAKLDLVVTETKELMAAQTKALTVMAESMQMIATFLNTGLPQALAVQAKANGVSAILQGLMSKEGRNGLDARFIKQNAIESVQAIEAVHDEYQEILKAKANKELDPKLHDGESEFKKWLKDSEPSQEEK